MSLYKRKDSTNWWVKIAVPGCRPVQESTGTADRIAAQEYHDRRKAELWRQSRLKEKPRYLWEEAVLKFLEETSHKRDHQGDIERLGWLDTYLGGKYLDEIDKEVIEQIKYGKRDRKPATINRYLATVRTILRKAEREWEWIDRAPFVRLLPEPQGRVRWISQEEAERLLAALPGHLSAAAEFSLATGLRQSNVLGLQWEQIDMARHTAWVFSDQAKGKRDIAVPLNESALAVLRRRLGTHEQFVFTYSGRPLAGVDSETWKRATKKAGITNFKWHDLRHTWASWHVMAGTSLQELMELGGWRDIKMVLRYAHLSSDHLRKAAANVAFAGTNQLRGDIQLSLVEGSKKS